MHLIARNECPQFDTVSLDQAKSYIYSIDFSSIINRLVKYSGWNRSEALTICDFYRNYLFLNKKHAEQYDYLPPSEEIDEFWHEHILDTQKYHTDCQVIFGKYLHHIPNSQSDSLSDMADINKAFQVTQELHFQEFGYYIYGFKKSWLKSLTSSLKELI